MTHIGATYNTLDIRLREKVRLTNSILRSGIKLNQYYLSYVRIDQKPPKATGNTYEVFYKGKLIGFV
ncbi:hypothetical protein P4U07_26050 [Bacillus mycoides]|uniref:hypothetical protein n=1 Tax=Bacillus mycoides TaxID=1405 RepID=UPI002E1A8CC0|nr:hypothetical protein [Bacillus mycoides]